MKMLNVYSSSTFCCSGGKKEAGIQAREEEILRVVTPTNQRRYRKHDSYKKQKKNIRSYR